MAPEAAIASTLTFLRSRLRQEREELANAFITSPHPQHYLHRHAHLVDSILCALCERLLPGNACLAAVGGYGRGELFPSSDVDVLVLIPDSPDERMQSRLESFVQSCWDAGLEIGHSIRTPMECVEESGKDITIETALLESRFVWGDRVLFDRFRELFNQRFNPRRFAEGKLLEQKNRHNRLDDSAYRLEPNLKDSPGGLRDLHMIQWLGLAAKAGSDWKSLAGCGLLPRTEATRLARIQRDLNRLRIQLHLLARRREDRLAFDYQTRLAENLGLTASKTRRASELLMQRYYRAAKQVMLANEMLIPALRAKIQNDFPKEVILDDEYALLGNTLALRDQNLFKRDPGAIFRAYLTAMRHSIPAFAPGLLNAMWQARFMVNAGFRSSPENQSAFLEILREPHGVTWALRAMSRYGILGRYLPAFGRIAGQMQHDGFHIYTVDEHTLAVLRNVRRFTIAEFAHEYPLASRLISGFEKPELLILGALFHDIAKGRGGDHSVLGMRDARRFCRLHRLPHEDAELVAWLVREHLTMSRIAQKEDLSDPEVIEAFANKVGDLRHLDALYILTVADIRGTSPKVWNAWKGKLLEDLYHAARACLTGEAHATGGITGKQEAAREKLALYGIKHSSTEVLWRQFDETYFLRFETADIAWHARMLWQKPDTSNAIVRARLSPAGEGIQVLVYCHDMPDLFSRVCGFFTRNQFSVVDAKIHTTRHGYALDSFQVLDDASRNIHYRDFLQFVEHELALELDPARSPSPVAPGRYSRRLRHFPIQPEIEIRPDERGRYHILSLTCGDRTGLLHGIAQIFQRHGIILYSARIHTLGERVEDRFLIRGESLDKQKSLLELEQDLLSVLK
ncbi:MAG: [protein-PII] uridylyltransferase [Hydrogenophilaceae bacterium]|nr:[protein-PII] uridylyltransferase [Hydrogenophilaceae bacterium]